MMSLIKNNICSHEETRKLIVGAKKNPDIIFNYYFLEPTGLKHHYTLLKPEQYYLNDKVQKIKKLRKVVYTQHSTNSLFEKSNIERTFNILQLNHNLSTKHLIAVKKFEPQTYNIGDLVMVNNEAYAFVVDCKDDLTQIKTFQDQKFYDLTSFGLELLLYALEKKQESV